ncbi:hypothetical protein ACET3Z_013592 [Daucus carota]
MNFYAGAVPANILQVMNVEGLTRDQVASHLQLRDEQRKGNLAAQNPLRPQKEGNLNIAARAPNGSLSSFQRLPKLILREESSSRTIYETFLQKTYGSANLASSELGNAPSPKPRNKHRDPSMDISLCETQFGNTSAMNTHELGGENLTDGRRFNNLEREDGNDYSLNIGNDEDGGEDKDLNPERDL